MDRVGLSIAGELELSLAWHVAHLELISRHKDLATELRREIDITNRLLNHPNNLLHGSEDAKADFLLLAVRTELRISQSLDLLKRSHQISAAVSGRNR